MKKIDGVESVKVSLNDSKASLVLKADNTVSLGQLFAAIEKNGFNPREASVRIRGQLTPEAAGWTLRVNGTRDVLGIVVPPAEKGLGERLQASAGKTVTVKGTLPPPEKGKVPPTIAVTSLE
jgi:hypothetical protein